MWLLQSHLEVEAKKALHSLHFLNFNDGAITEIQDALIL